MKQILITGGAGFIGTHLCEKLLFEGNSVFCLDNFISGSKKNIQHLLSHNNFKLVTHDIVNPYYNNQIDEIYNLACPASPVQYQQNPIKTIKTSILGSINMLGMAKLNKAKILQASTSEVYGNPSISPQNEKYWGNVNPIGKRSCYDEGKRCAESLFMNYFEKNTVQIKIARIFNTYGPNMMINDGRAISNFIIQALTNKNITIYGNGEQTRAFQYISDLTEGLVRLMNTPADITGPINLGSTHEVSINEIANLIISLTGSTSKIEHKTLPEDDPTQRKPDITKAKESLNNWEPVTDLKTGLKNTIEYFDNELKNNRHYNKYNDKI